MPNKYPKAVSAEDAHPLMVKITKEMDDCRTLINQLDGAAKNFTTLKTYTFSTGTATANMAASLEAYTDAHTRYRAALSRREQEIIDEWQALQELGIASIDRS